MKSVTFHIILLDFIMIYLYNILEFKTSIKNLEKNNGPRRNIVADYHLCNLIILSSENKRQDSFYQLSILVGKAGRSKNGRGHFRLILCMLFLPHY